MRGLFAKNARPLATEQARKISRVIWGMISIFATGAFSRGFRLLVNHEVTLLHQNFCIKCELVDLTLKIKGNSNLYSQTAVVDSGNRRVGADLYAQAFQIRKTSSGDNESTFLQTVAQTEKASGGPAGFIQMGWKMQIDKG